MENRRFLLIITLGVILYFMYQAWEQDHAPAPVVGAAEIPVEPAVGAAAPVDDEIPVPPAAGTQAGNDAVATPAATADLPRIRVETDVLQAEIALRGGDLRRVAFPQYPVTKDHPEVPVELVTDRNGKYFVIQGGLTTPEGPLASHHDEFSSRAERYRLAEGQDALIVALQRTLADGTRIIKRYTFTRGSYEIRLEHLVLDNAAPREISPYLQMVREDFDLGGEPRFIRSFKGIGVYEQKPGSDKYRFRKFSADELVEEPQQWVQTGGWISMMQHYFLAAIVPPGDESLRLAAKPSKTRGYMAQYLGAARSVPAGGTARFAQKLYVGPKLQERLEDVAPGFALTIDYGIFTVIAGPLFWLLNLLHDLLGNWGFAIIALTLIVKMALYKLSEAQYRSMAKMRKFAPRIQNLKERYGDDRERMQKAMMDLYKKEGFNPLAGCWPMLVQFPVFIALYWVLLESVELRQADFIGWLNDLSAPDPYYILPVLFGLSMYLQQRLSGTAMTADPMQQRIMSAMPILLTAFFSFFPIGLVLYWLVSNLVGLAQQWYIMRKLDLEGLKK